MVLAGLGMVLMRLSMVLGGLSMVMVRPSMVLGGLGMVLVGLMAPAEDFPHHQQAAAAPPTFTLTEPRQALGRLGLPTHNKANRNNLFNSRTRYNRLILSGRIHESDFLEMV